MTDQSLPKSARLLASPQFKVVFDQKNSVADRTLVIYAARNDVGCSRLGMAVSRKIGNAVVRNRWKRFIREGFRKAKVDLPVGLDLIVLPKRGAKPSQAAIGSSLPYLVKKANARLHRIAGGPQAGRPQTGGRRADST